MPVISRSSLVMYSVEEMYSLVNDVSAYAEFLPDCGESKIISQNETSMTASLLVSKGLIKKWFTTNNVLVSNESITLKLVDGPFKKLTGSWHFKKLSEEACKISLELDYEFSSKVLGMAFGRVFENLCNNMMQAFIQRANNVYSNKVSSANE